MERLRERKRNSDLSKVLKRLGSACDTKGKSFCSTRSDAIENTDEVDEKTQRAKRSKMFMKYRWREAKLKKSRISLAEDVCNGKVPFDSV